MNRNRHRDQENSESSGRTRVSRNGKDENRTPVVRYCFVLGLFAGVIWGGIRWLLYTLAFTGVLPGFLAEPFYRRSFLVTWGGHLTGMLYFTLFSIAAAYLYKLLLGRLKGPYPGIAYGLAWWAVLFLWIGPQYGMSSPLGDISWRSLVTEACVFAMWGTFIGYSIAFEYHDEAGREPSAPLGTLLKP